jgi:tRNA threonylcarbamoyladenosine biosynthesis protein TsaE
MVYDSDSSTQSARETAEIGQTLAIALKKSSRPTGSGEKGKASTVVCLYGNLGSGKSTFVRGFALGLGISIRLPSPTFLIVRRYLVPSFNFFYHIDLYRVTEEDFDELGLFEFFADNRSFVAVEWAEKLGELLPNKRVDVRFTVLDNGRHHIRMTERR